MALFDVSDSSSEEIEYEERVFRVGPHAFKVQCIGELPMEMLFRLESARDEISGQRAWPGSLLLGLELARAPGRVGGKAVLELGAGCGIVGMAAAKFGAKPCVLSDGDCRCLTLLKENVEANSLEASCGVMRLLWGVDAPHRTYDVVLAGDVLYKRELIAPFLAALEAALAEDGTALLCHLPRAGVSHDVVAAALRESPNLSFASRAAAADASDLAAFGDDCTADDVAAARLYEISLGPSAEAERAERATDSDSDSEADDDAAPSVGALDDGDATKARFSARVCYGAVDTKKKKVDLGDIQAHYETFRAGLVYRASETEVVVAFPDDASLARALADTTPFRGVALVATREA